MIYEITREIETELRAKGYPYRVVYGPDGDPGRNEARVVIDRDLGANEDIAPPMSKRVNPKQFGVRWLPCRATIYAREPRAGALMHEHTRQCDRAVDKLTIAMHKVIIKRDCLYRVTAAGYLTLAALDAEAIEHFPGVVYRLAFAVSRGVSDTTWAEAAADEGAPANVATVVAATEYVATAGEVSPAAKVEHGSP